MSATQKFLKDVQVASRYGVSRPTVWRWIREREFPKPVRLSPRCSRWTVDAIERWEQSQFPE